MTGTGDFSTFREMVRFPVRSLPGIALVSSATLCLQASLTRYFAVSQGYHFAFLIISLVFLGYGASGSALTLFPALRRVRSESFLTGTSLLYSISIMGSFLVANVFPFEFQEILWREKRIFLVFLIYLVFSIPFFFAGLVLSTALARFTEDAHRLYFTDLLGAGSGALLALFVFMPAGDRGVFLIIALLPLSAAFLFCPSGSLLIRSSILILFAAGILLLILSPSWLEFHISPFKALPLALKQPHAESVLTKWNNISRVDVLHSPATRAAPGLSLIFEGTLPAQIGITRDGEDLNAWPGRIDSPIEDSPLPYLPSFWPYTYLEKPRVMIIEPKGGLDVLAAEGCRASPIILLEENPLVADILRSDLAAWTGELYSQPHIQIHTGMARASLRKIQGSFDIIVFSLTDITGSAGTGLFGFHENHLLTLQSFDEILQHLSPQGLVSMTLYLVPPPRLEMRALAMWIEALSRRQKDPAAHLILLRTWGTLSIFVKGQPFTAEEIAGAKEFADKLLFDLDYYPGIEDTEPAPQNIKTNRPVYKEFARSLLSDSDRLPLYKSYLFNIRPVPDSRPFFFNFFKWGRIKETYEAFGKRALPLLQGAYLVPLLFVQALIVSFVLLILPLRRLAKGRTSGGGRARRALCYFTLIGAGFMFVEITLIQKFILYLGHALYSVSVVLFSLLLTTGLGSLLSERLLSRNRQIRLRLALIGCGFGTMIYLSLLPLYMDWTFALPLVIKMALTPLVLFPLGFFLGVPFPTAIRSLGTRDASLVPWAWAVNSFSSVNNSILALLVAFVGGYSLVLGLGGLLYLGALPFQHLARHGDEPNI